MVTLRYPVNSVNMYGKRNTLYNPCTVQDLGGEYMGENALSTLLTLKQLKS